VLLDNDFMGAKSHKRRIKVITDPVKYRSHQRKKFLRKLGKVAVGVIIFALCAVTIWWVLNTFFQAPPLE
jgi:hypothetical protein